MRGISQEGRSLSGSTTDATRVEKLPPVSEIGIAALILVVVGGIYLSSYPRGASLLLPAVLAVVAALLVLVGAVVLVRSKTLASETFVRVGKWSLLVYFIVAGMLEYVFVFDGTRGRTLIVLSAMLLIFALDVPMIIAYTVARYNKSSGGGGS